MANTDLILWIRGELLKRGWSQSELSRRSGVSPSHIGRFLSEERGVSEESINGFARAFGVPPETLFRIAGFLPPVSKKTELINQILDLTTQLPEKDQQEILDYARMRVQLLSEKRGNNAAKLRTGENPARP